MSSPVQNLARASDANLRMLSRGIARGHDASFMQELHRSHNKPIGHATPHHRASHPGNTDGRKVRRTTRTGAAVVMVRRGCEEKTQVCQVSVDLWRPPVQMTAACHPVLTSVWNSARPQVSAVTESRLNRWVTASAVIYTKTGISEVGLFFQKFSNW